MEEKKEEVTGTLRKDKTLLRDEKKMEKLKQKLHTDDECKQKWGKGAPEMVRGQGTATYLLFIEPQLLQATVLDTRDASVIKQSLILTELSILVREGRK